MSRQAKVWWNAQKGTWCSEIGGKRRTLAKGRQNRRHAVARLKALEAEQALLAEVNGAISVALLCEHFLEFAEQNLERRTYESYRYACQKFTDHFGALLAHTVTTHDLDRFLTLMKPTLNDTTQAIVLRSVVRCFNWGVERALIPPHKLRNVHFPASQSRERYLTDEEFQALLRGTNPQNCHRTGAPFRRLLLALDWTLCRPGELAQLEWKHVHWDRNVAILPNHKTKRTGNPKIIALIPKMKRLLRWLEQKDQSSYCFVNSRGLPWRIRSINHRMDHVRKRAGISDVMPYTIRHRAATNAIIKTGDLKMTSQLLGHTSSKMTERYLHLAQSRLVAFAERALG